jgi:cyclic pyranopterin phosphate synthase
MDAQGNPAMVDVSGKTVTFREATAESVVVLPGEVAKLAADGDIIGPKGPIVQTAIVAGTMAAKKTEALIPFCHQVALSSVRFSTRIDSDRLTIRCTVAARDVTGVEMEALTGVSVAALTVYDMCKSISHGIRITETRLLEKRGGKSDYASRQQ